MTLWTVSTLVASALLMALVLPLRAPVSRAFGARAAYSLWALPALRLVMPSLPSWHAFYVPFWHVGSDTTTIGLATGDDIARLAAATPPALPSAPAMPQVIDATPSWSTILLWAWLGGAALWFGWQMVRYQLFLARALRSATLVTRECGVDVLLTGAVDGPVAAGILKRRIFLPLDFMTRYGPAERRLALLHEGAHHDRRDILANLAALAVLALHWFNPLAHRAYRAFRADQELACDATVLADIGAADRHAYGSAVIKSASARMPGVACALSHKAELKRRLKTMALPVPGRARSWAGAGIALAAVGAGLLATASGHATTPEMGLSSDEVAQIQADAEQARRDGLRAADDARRAAADARREGDRARAEALREVAQARDESLRAAAESRREAEQGRAEAMREAAQARAESLRAAAEARREGERERAYGQTMRAQYAGEGARQIAAVRQSMAAKCAARGHPVSPDLDWSRLALCGDSGAAMAARINAQVHRSLAAQGIAHD